MERFLEWEVVIVNKTLDENVGTDRMNAIYSEHPVQFSKCANNEDQLNFAQH